MNWIELVHSQATTSMNMNGRHMGLFEHRETPNFMLNHHFPNSMAVMNWGYSTTSDPNDFASLHIPLHAHYIEILLHANQIQFNPVLSMFKAPFSDTPIPLAIAHSINIR